MTTVSHLDPSVLEGELLDRIAGVKSADPLARILVVVPTARLSDHVGRRIATKLGAAIGIDILTHRALATRILARGGRTMRVADPSIEDALLARVVDRSPRGRLRDFVRERPVARPGLAATLTDLRDAGVDAEALPRGEVREIFTRWTNAWDELTRERGLTDEAGLAREARPLAAALGRSYAAIFHHGAYELIGVHGDLVAALDAGAAGTKLRPAIGEDEFPDLRAKDVRFADAQGARNELTRAVSSVLARIADGAPPEEQAIVVRSFAPYASAVEALLLDDALAWHTSFASSLRRVASVAGVLTRVAAETDRPAARWSAHAEALGALVGDRDDEATARLHGILDAMRSLEFDLGDVREVPAEEAAAYLTARVDAATLPPGGEAGGGPRLLDAMQARGMTFDHVGLVGMNSGIWPRVPREDPFLSDETRRRLRAETGRPVPIPLDNDGEERLLLAMTLGSARRALDVSWRRADDHGRPVVPSLALRAIERAARVPVLRSLPAHPRSRLESLARDPAVMRPEDEIVLVALAADAGADASAAVRERRPELAAGLAWVAATDAFDPRELSYDGRIGARLEARAISVSQLETLARCPLQFFFEHRLGIEAADRADSPYEPSRSKLGSLIHDVLREVYERLVAEGRFDGADLSPRIARAQQLMRQAWSARAEEFAATRTKPLPVVDRIETELWWGTLDEFLTEDLTRLAASGEAPIEFETKRDTKDIPDLPPMTARLDRIVVGPGGRVVGDYKTGGAIDRKVGMTAILKGDNLQAAVYSLIEGVPVDLLGVGRDHAVRRARFDGFGDPSLRAGALETVRTVAALAHAGSFPIRPGRHCAWCAFRSACRRSHPPTEFREEHAADTRDLRDLGGKNTKQPTLAQVRAGRTT